MRAFVANHLRPVDRFNTAVRLSLNLQRNIPQVVIFNQMQLAGSPFVPYGVFSSSPCRIKIRELNNFQFEVTSAGKNYPAPINQTLEIYGEGDTLLVFVDFPILLTAQITLDFPDIS